MKKRKREIHHSEILDRIKHSGGFLFATLHSRQSLREQKKMPANEGRAQPKIGPRDAEFGAAHRLAARLSAITHIGCVYADELSIGAEYDPSMTLLKRTQVRRERIQLRPVYQRCGIKKKPASESGLQTIFLEENSGDR